MHSKKTIMAVLIVVIVLILGGLAYFFYHQAPTSGQNGPVPAVSQSQLPVATNTLPSSVPVSATATFDANDNLDQAVQDLNTIVK